MGSFDKTNRRDFTLKILKDKLAGFYSITYLIASKQYFKTESKLKRELSTDTKMENVTLKKLPTLAEDIYVKTREALQNANCNKREVLVTDKPLKTIQVKLVNNNTK